MDGRPTSTFAARLRPAPSAAPARVGAWELLGVLGTGTWATVYRARPAASGPQTEGDYAVKVPRDDADVGPLARRLLWREAEVGRAVTHSHLIAVLAAQVEREPYHLVMPRLVGATVGSWVRHAGPMPPARALWITRQVAEALAAVHAAGWIHADVKPDNILLSAHGHATLLDLGFALRAGSSECHGGAELRGTLNYTSPEMFSAVEDLDPQTDIYSLGATLYEMLTGHTAFQIPRRGDLTPGARVVPNPRHWVPDLHPKISKLLQQMLARHPLRRPSAAALIDQLVDLEILVLNER